jgi:hypothetical protein
MWILWIAHPLMADVTSRPFVSYPNTDAHACEFAILPVFEPHRRVVDDEFRNGLLNPPFFLRE